MRRSIEKSHDLFPERLKESFTGLSKESSALQFAKPEKPWLKSLKTILYVNDSIIGRRKSTHGPEMELRDKSTLSFDDRGNMTSEIEYIYDIYYGRWEKEYKTEVIWDGDNKVSEIFEYYWSSSSEIWIHETWTEFSYDNEGRRAEVIEYTRDWDDTSWELSEKITYAYNEDGHETLYIRFTYDSDDDIWVEYTKYVTEYDGPDGQITRRTQYWTPWDEEQIYPYRRHEYFWKPDGELDYGIIWEYDRTEEEWSVESYFETTFLMVGQQPRPVEVIYFLDEDDEKILLEKENYDWDVNDNLTSYAWYRYNDENNSWLKISKAEYIFDLDVDIEETSSHWQIGFLGNINNMLLEINFYRSTTGLEWYLNSDSRFYYSGYDHPDPDPIPVPEPDTFNLDINISGIGEVFVNDELYEGSLTFTEGEIVELSALPAPGWVFEGWGGTYNAYSEMISITMNRDHDITAHFGWASDEDRTIDFQKIGEGTILVNGYPYWPGARYEPGTIIHIEAVPDDGWVFSGWSGSLTSDDPEQYLEVDDDLELIA
ncbi:MAG: hypothetical protein EA408_00265, partial [Marinilabiliales bacterium]